MTITVTPDEAKEIARELGVDFSAFSIEAFIAGIKVEGEHKDVTGGNPVTTAKIALAHLKEDPEYYTKLAKIEKTNSVSQKPSFFYARHMQPGTCRYDSEMILVDTEALQSMIRTGGGIPVYIHHQPNVPIEDTKKLAIGYVTESFYNELDGWAWFKFMAIDDEARIAISDGWSVSNAYVPTQWGSNGTKNNVAYDREIISGEFTHLAIVPDPRYENACIMTPEQFKAYQEEKKSKLSELQNSNPKQTTSKGKPMFKLFKNERKEVSTVDADTQVELEDGKVVSVGEMMNAMKKNSDDGDEDEKKKAEDEKMNAEVDVDGEKMPLKELVNRYKKMNEKRNAAEEEEKKNAAEEEAKKKEAEEKANAEEEEKKKAEKENGMKNFKMLQNAKGGQEEAVRVIETSAVKVQRGLEQYGAKK